MRQNLHEVYQGLTETHPGGESYYIRRGNIPVLIPRGVDSQELGGQPWLRIENDAPGRQIYHPRMAMVYPRVDSVEMLALVSSRNRAVYSGALGKYNAILFSGAVELPEYAIPVTGIHILGALKKGLLRSTISLSELFETVSEPRAANH